MKPCPFCESNKLDVRRFVSDRWYTCVRCEKCGAEGPHIPDPAFPLRTDRTIEHCETMAVDDWDTRS